MSESPLILDGKSVAAKLKGCLKNKVTSLKEQTGKSPCLAVVLVGDNPASQVYVRNKEKAAAEVGIKSIMHTLSASTKFNELQTLLKELNENEDVNGILLQLPLPKGLEPEPFLLQIDPLKDVDGLHPFNLGMIMAGHPNLIPCTPYGVMRILDEYSIDVEGMRACVLGRSRLVGKPIAELLINESATVTVVHSRTPQEEQIEILRNSDLVVAAIGKAHYVKAEWLKPGAVVIDVGINRLENGKLAGDVDFEAALEKVSAITPVPGGIGPLTVAHLLLNTVKAFEIQCFGESYIDF